MYLIAVFASLWADHRFPDYIDLRHFSLYRFITKTFISLGIGASTAWLPYVLVTVVPALIIKTTISVLGFVFIIEIIFWAVVLYICLPSDPISKQVKDYVDACKSGDKRGIDTYARSLLGSEPPKDSSERNLLVARAVLSKQSMHVVAVFFWFSVMGIGAAIFYKLNWVLKESDDSSIRNHAEIQSYVQIALGLMAWIPAKLMMLVYGLVGSFTPVMKNLFRKRSSSENRWQGNVRILADTGIAAMRLDSNSAYTEDQVSQSWLLVRRANIALLLACVFLALFNFVAWF